MLFLLPVCCCIPLPIHYCNSNIEKQYWGYNQSWQGRHEVTVTLYQVMKQRVADAQFASSPGAVTCSHLGWILPQLT